jgi:hypothetical protein
VNRNTKYLIHYREQERGCNRMKKYISIIFLVVILMVIVFTSNQSVKVIRHILVTKETKSPEDQIVIAIDPGHPHT